MYKCLNYWTYGGFEGSKSPREFIDFAAAEGLDGVEFTVGEAIKLDISEAECKAIATYAKERGIALRTLATGKYGALSLGAADETERKEAVEFTRRYLEIASWIGVETILVIPGATCVAWAPERPVVPYDITWKNSTASIKELLPVAERLGINIALENVWTHFLFSPMEWKFFLEQFYSPCVGMYFDVGNCTLYVKPQDYVEMLGNRIKAVHLKSFKGFDFGGGLSGFVDDLLVGDVDLVAIVKTLNSAGYTGPLTVEMVPFSQTLPNEPLCKKMAKQLHELEARI